MNNETPSFNYAVIFGSETPCKEITRDEFISKCKPFLKDIEDVLPLIERLLCTVSYRLERFWISCEVNRRDGAIYYGLRPDDNRQDTCWFAATITRKEKVGNPLLTEKWTTERIGTARAGGVLP